MNNRKNSAFKSKEDLMKFGFRNLVTDTTDNLTKDDKNTIQELINAEKALEELSKLEEFSVSFLPPGLNLFSHQRAIYPDGAKEIADGWLEKNFYRDFTNKNKITNIDISIVDEKKHPQSPAGLLINVVLRNREQAQKFNDQFKAAKLDMVPTGTHACAFANYSSLEYAFQKFDESKIISKPNADIILSEIKLFLEGRNLISRSSAAKASR